jgi:hypothetical protein
MIKIKYFSVYSDFKSSFLTKLFFLLSGIFLFLYLVIYIFDFVFNDVTSGVIGFIVSLTESSIVDISLAMIILFAGLGIITLFFHHQFKKLANIADEIENINKPEE